MEDTKAIVTALNEIKTCLEGISGKLDTLQESVNKSNEALTKITQDGVYGLDDVCNSVEGLQGCGLHDNLADLCDLVETIADGLSE